MTIAVVASTKFAGASGGTTSAIDTTGANCIAVFMAYGGSPTLSDNKGNTYTAGTASGSVLGRWYYCLGATTGTGHTFTVGGGSTASSIVVYALSGVATSSAYSSPGGTDITTNPWTFRVDETPAGDNYIALVGATLNTTSTLTGVTPGSGWTNLQWNTPVGGTNYGSVVVHQIQTTARTIGASESLATLSGNTGSSSIMAFFAPGAPASGITITTPNQYEVHQRSGSTGSIQISGTYTGSPTAIEASFNGGAYSTIVASPTGGTYSGTLTAQAQGQGTLTVRFTNDTAINATQAYVGIGDVFVVAGDSISEGRGTSAQSYTHATLKAGKFREDDAWAEGNDGIDTGTSSGSHWPLLATHIMASQGVPVAFVSCGTGSTDVAGSNNQWAKNNSGYAGLTAQVTDSTASGIKGVLMHLGPNAVVNASTLSLATYNTALDTLASNLAADVVGAPKLNIGIFGQVTTGSPPDRRAAIDNIRGAILQAHGDNSNIKPGPVLIDQSYSDGVHPATNTQLQQVADRWWIALSETYYGGSGGRGPRLSSAMWNAGRNQLTVTFDRTLKTGLTFSTAPWIVKDNGSAMTVSGVAYHGTNASAIVITTSAAAVGAAGTTTLTFASSNDAAGVVVPLSADITLPTASTTQIPAEPIYSATVAEYTATATTVSVTLTSDGINPAASLSGLSWAFFDQAVPSSFAAPVAKGSGATTTSGGVFTATITGTALTVGATGWLIVSNSDGTTTQSGGHKAFSGPVVVS